MYKVNKLKNLNKWKCIIFNNCECYTSYSTKNEFPGRGVAYNPKEIENAAKENANYFVPPINDKLKPFSIILPPPNITGTLHLGHALTVTIQDVLVRWYRMRRYETQWIPGIDHAGIATQVVVEKKLWKERNVSRHDLGREDFQEEVWKWKNEKEKVITAQLRRLAPSIPHSSTNPPPFTMDPAHSAAVTRAFISLHQSDLIYRADRLVNWSCRLQSAISDIEVERKEVGPGGKLHVPGYDREIEFGRWVKFGYKVVDSDEELVVATTRPETIPGDVAVAVHPADTRYTRYIGRTVWNPFRNEAIPVIADDFVDRNYGTGVVKITPAHDPADFAVSLRHNLPCITIITPSGHLSANCADSALVGQHRFDARALVTDSLANRGLLRGTDAHALTVPICTRSGDVVEYLVRPQWFVRCEEMTLQAIEAVRDGRLRIEPREQFERVWFAWLGNIRDWCISRQLWWGHRIPAYIVAVLPTSLDSSITTSTTSHSISPDNNNNCWIAAYNENEARLKGAIQLGVTPAQVTCIQDEDVLDTWFSSALLPFSLNGWPNECDSINKYYPLSMMETGHDILFFWVARMVMLGSQLTGKLPFDTVLLHGVICDALGRKMSKSVGNVIAPEDVIYGATLQELEETSRVNHELGVLTKDELSSAVKNQKKMFPEGIPQCGADALRFTLCSHNIKSHFINFDVQECKTNKFFGNKIWQATKFTIKWISTIENSKKPHMITLSNLTAIDYWILSRLTHMVDIVNESIGKYDFHTATNALKGFIYYEFCDVYVEACKRGLQSLQYHQEKDPKHRDSELLHNEQGSNLLALGHCYTLMTCLDRGLRALAPFMPTLAEHLHRNVVANDRFGWVELDLSYPQDLSWRNVKLELDIEQVLEIVTGIRRLKKMFHVTGKHNPTVTLQPSTPKLNLNLHQHTNLITDLSACHQVNISANHEDQSSVSDNVLGGLIRVHLHIPEDVKSNLLAMDVDVLDKQKVKLAKELEKIRSVIEGIGYEEKVGEVTHRSNLKKIATLEEKMTRIDLMKTYSSKR